MSLRWIIDDRGDIWPEAGPGLSQALRTSRRGADLTRFLIRQMGFVGFAQTAKRHQLNFDASIVSALALSAYLSRSCSEPFCPTICSDPSEPAVASLLGSRSALHEYLGRLIDARLPAADFQAEAVELDGSPFADRWRAGLDICNADMPLRRKLDLIERLFDGQFAVGTHAENGTFQLLHAGRTLRQADPAQLLPQGSPMTAVPFDPWTAGLFRAVEHTSPHAQSINTVMTWHSAMQGRFDYHRLTLPLPLANAPQALLVAVSRA